MNRRVSPAEAGRWAGTFVGVMVASAALTHAGIKYHQKLPFGSNPPEVMPHKFKNCGDVIESNRPSARSHDEFTVSATVEDRKKTVVAYLMGTTRITCQETPKGRIVVDEEHCAGETHTFQRRIAKSAPALQANEGVHYMPGPNVGFVPGSEACSDRELLPADRLSASSTEFKTVRALPYEPHL